MESLFVIVPIFIIGVFLFIAFQIARQVAEWADNNGRPVVSEAARVVAKRTQTSGNMSSNSAGSVSTAYYATFELESGERREFLIAGNKFGLLVEGDDGTLTSQGTRYHGFERGRRPVESPDTYRA